MSATRIGIVGAGAVAARHAACLSAFDDVHVAAVADVHFERASGLARACGGQPYRDHETMLADARLDAVYLCLPPFAHGAPEHAVVGAGLPFFVEKPLAMDVATAESIGETVRKAGVLTATGYWWRHLDVVERAQEALADDPPRLAVGAWLDKVPPPAWWLRRELSGGQLVEQATHVIDLLRVLVGDVQAVWATASLSNLPGADIDDVTAGTLRFSNGAIGSLVSTCALGWKHTTGVQLYGARSAVEVTDTTATMRRGDHYETLVSHIDAKTRADRAFVDAVQGKGDDVRAAYDDALASHRVACALAASARSGQPIELTAA